MTTEMTAEMQLQMLHAPFDVSADLEWRFQSAGKGQQGGTMLPYVTARAVMDRLDSVVQPGNWSTKVWADPGPLAERTWYCELTVKLADGRVMTQVDVADATQIEPSKGGSSDALKRVAVKVGIGRYLYFLPKFYVDSKPSPMWKWNQHIAEHLPKKCPWAVPGGAGRPTEGKGSSGWQFDTSFSTGTGGPPVEVGDVPDPAPAAPAQRAAPPQSWPKPDLPPARQPAQPQRPPAQPQRKGGKEEAPDPDVPLPNTAPPFDLNTPIFFGQFKGKAWGWAAMGSPEGRRRQWLQWLSDNRSTFEKQSMQEAGYFAAQVLDWLNGKATPADDPWSDAPPHNPDNEDTGKPGGFPWEGGQ